MYRRRALRLAGATAAGLAGCVGGSAGDGTPTGERSDREGSADADGGDATATPTAGGSSIQTHPATADLAAQPTRGTLDGNLILAFEDPSCSRCRAFHRVVLPRIEENLLAPGKAAYVYRNYPVVFPWGQDATEALEATFDRDAGAFWDLLGHYFEIQDEIDRANVLDRTASFLDGETDLDADAVVADVEAGAFEDAVQADVDAAEAAEIGRTTPTLLLFRDGEYVTKAAGSVSYELIATTLGVSG